MNALQRDLKKLVPLVESLGAEKAAADPHRQRFHLQPPVGWLNDPNGLCVYGGQYHAFFQYGPFDVNGGGKHWGHAVSTDLLHWEQLPVMLYPDEPFDCHGAYSGSALVEDGTMYLYYTGNVKHPGNFDYIKEGRGHNVCLAVSKDGVTLDMLLAAILSDTLVFRSPTCTPIDVNAANRLAKLAGVDINEFANEMFEAGEKLDGKTAEEVFLQDFKVFMCGDIRFGVAQGSYMTRKNLTAAEALLKPYLEEARNKQNVEDIYMLLTDVPKEESVVICNGRYAAGVLTDGFDIQPDADGSWTLPGVVSRKKQFIPALMTAYQEL